MARYTLLLALAGVGLLLGFNGTKPRNVITPPSDNPAEFAISGPYTHENLSIFLLHGPDTLPPRNVLTLDEALAQNKAIVHETGTVNTLCVENLSDDSDLMMQNGDIVKGGRQDRVLRVAMILPPKSGPVAVESFCVEQGRWTNRGTESATQFGSNPGQIAGKDLKLAVNIVGQQGEVWKNVAVAQTALNANNSTSVTANASPTSLQLAVENKELQASLAAYRDSLGKVLDGKTGVVGYAIAVNGKVTGAEVYGSSVLMTKAWKKAVNAAALEAIAEKKATEYAVCKAGNVRSFLADAGGKNEESTVTASNRATHTDDLVVQFMSYEDATRNRTHGTYPVTLPVTNPNALNALSQNQFNSYQIGLRVDIPTRTPVLPPVRDVELDNPVAVQLDASRSGATRNVVVTGDGSQTSLNPLTFLAQFSGGEGNNGPTPVANAAQPVQAPPVQVNRVMGTNGVLVESRDRANPGVIIHRTFIAK